MRQAPSCQYLRFWGKQGYKSNITTSLFPKLYSLKSIKQNTKLYQILDWNRNLKVFTVFLLAFIQFQIFDFNPIALGIRFSPFLFGNGRWVNVKLEKMATGSLSSGIVISPTGGGWVGGWGGSGEGWGFEQMGRNSLIRPTVCLLLSCTEFWSPSSLLRIIGGYSAYLFSW